MSSAKLTCSSRWRGFRKSILGRDSHICFFCDNHGDTVDHLTPITRGGGRFDESNCVCACLDCNQEKNDMLLSEYMSFLNDKESD